jgi:hypothetical protein
MKPKSDSFFRSFGAKGGTRGWSFSIIVIALGHLCNDHFRLTGRSKRVLCRLNWMWLCFKVELFLRWDIVEGAGSAWILIIVTGHINVVILPGNAIWLIFSLAGRKNEKNNNLLYFIDSDHIRLLGCRAKDNS